MRLISACKLLCGPAGWPFLLLTLASTLGGPPSAVGEELSVEDFTFEGPSGSHGASIEKIGRNHFKVTLGHAPQHPDWCNMLQFRILRHAKGNRLRLDVVFGGGNAYRFNHNSSTWSYDAEHWRPIAWAAGSTDSAQGDTLLFAEFTEDSVHFGHQVPMSYEQVVELMDRWGKHPHAEVHVLGESLGGRNIYRLAITDPQSPHPAKARWGHYFANQHPGEHNSQWRMVGMVDWLLGREGADCRRSSICHFILMSSPDGPSHGWYRVNAQGVDMNRSYFVDGADPKQQAHEACVIQKDLEKLMASDWPVTDAWSMHTWGGIVEPLISPGPEMAADLGPWQRLKQIMQRHDPSGLVKPLKTRDKPDGATTWSGGPHRQFGITTVLCEGAGTWQSKQKDLDAGVVLIKAVAEYYRGAKPGS